MSELERRPVSAQLADAYTPRDFEQTLKMARMIAASGLCPKALRGKADAVWLVLAKGAELGVSGMVAMAEIHVIEGKPALSSRLMSAFVAKAPECEYMRPVEVTSERVTMETKHRDHPSPTRVTWTIEDAERAGLLGKDNWRKYPRAMLQARAMAELSRLVYPDRSIGLYLRDEIGEILEGNWQEAERVPPPEPSGKEQGGDDGGPTVTNGEVTVTADDAPTEETPTEDAVYDAPDDAITVAGDTETDARIDEWSVVLRQCETLDDLRDLGFRLKDEPDEIKTPVREAYRARRAELQRGGA